MVDNVSQDKFSPKTTPRSLNANTHKTVRFTWSVTIGWCYGQYWTCKLHKDILLIQPQCL